ncbi:MAG: hypothetical protein ACR2FY_24570 [Pirellulaceae bacterium]
MKVFTKCRILGANLVGGFIDMFGNAPMKYSLRSLMIEVTLVCVLLGGRIEYLRRWAEFHERAADSGRAWNSALIEGANAKGYRLLNDVKAEEYRAAMWRPWTIVEEPNP